MPPLYACGRCVMRVRVEYSGLRDLESDLRKAPETLAREGAKVVKQNVTAGLKLAQEYARARSGRHGKDYWKRLSADMTGPLTGEYGPHAGGTPVGAGWRHGPGNTDLPDSADVIGPKFAKSVEGLVDKIFWPES